MTTESKIVATDRLRSEDRWEEASLYRDEQRRRLRAEGKTRRETSEEAWRLMIEEFPPVLHDDEDDYEDEGESLERTNTVRTYGGERIFSVRAVAEDYGVHPQTVRRWITVGVDGGRILGSRKIGGRRCIGEYDLADWLMEGYEPPPGRGKRDQKSEELELQSAGGSEPYVFE